MTTHIAHIVFDIGKVLIHYDPELAFLGLIADRQERQHFLTQICTPEWNIEQDRGRSWEEAEALLVASHPGHEENIRAFRRNWHMMVPHAYDDSVAILERLIDAGHDVTMLTNFAADTFREAQKRFGFLNRSRGVTVSGEIRLIKPDPAIYRAHADRFGLDPAATLFIDDSAKNVEAARASGWKAIHFLGAPGLRQELATYGFEV